MRRSRSRHPRLYKYSALGALAFGLILATSACTRAISKEVRKQAEGQPEFSAVFANPQDHTGRTVIYGGVIVRIENTENETEIEIVQKELGSGRRPKETDKSGGRFLARMDGYLDPAIYAAEREITVAGRVTGSEQRSIGQTPYTYPVITLIEHHLWEERDDRDRPRWSIGLGYGYHHHR